MDALKELKGLLWSADFDNLDLQKDKYYIIHQTLSYGTLDHIKCIFKYYGREEVTNVFKKPYKDYRRVRFYFIKDALLGLKEWHPDEKLYVKNTPRVIG